MKKLIIDDDIALIILAGEARRRDVMNFYPAY